MLLKRSQMPLSYSYRVHKHTYVELRHKYHLVLKLCCVVFLSQSAFFLHFHNYSRVCPLAIALCSSISVETLASYAYEFWHMHQTLKLYQPSGLDVWLLTFFLNFLFSFLKVLGVRVIASKSKNNLSLLMYRPFHKTLPRSIAFVNWISVRFMNLAVQ